MDEDDVTGLYTGADDEGAVGGGRGDEEAGGLGVGPAVWDGEELLFAGDALGGEGTLGGAEDAGADGVFRVCRGGFEDDACEFAARCPGKSWGLSF